MFAEGVRKLRERQGVSARSLSIQAGLSPSYVSKIESGQTKPSVDAFARLMAAVGASEAEIIYMLGFCLTERYNGK